MKYALAILFFFLYFPSIAQEERLVVDSLLLGQEGIKNQLRNGGIVIGIYQNGKTSYYAHGTRKRGQPELLDSTTIFEIGSATKTFTALLLAQEIAKGRIGINDPIDKYLPANIRLPHAYRNQVKLTDLASHQSGLPNLSSDRYFNSLLERDGNNPFRFVDKAYLYTILRETDTLSGLHRYQYNNYAFALLGELLERHRQQTYAAIIEQEVLKPLGMSATRLGKPASPNVAGLYSQRGQEQKPMILAAVNPAGGLCSNAVDLMKYLKAELAANEKNRAMLLTQQAFYTDSKMQVGLGWDIAGDFFQKDGDTFGNSCLLRFSPKRQLAIVVLSNHQNGQLVRDAVDFVYEGLAGSANLSQGTAPK
jgi:CubicO group peptidase (beta-lactamase class C family)